MDVVESTEIVALTHQFIKLADLLLRGTDIKQLPNLEQHRIGADRFVQLSFSLNASNDRNDEGLIELAVKLFNSIRSLQSKNSELVNEIRSKLKLGISTLIMRFKYPHTPRSLEIVIKLFHHAADRKHLGLHNTVKCYEGTICAWDLLNQNNFASSYSHASIQETKLFVFKSFLNLASLAIDLRSPEAVEIARRNLMRALDIAQGLPLSIKVDLSEASLLIGSALADAPVVLSQSCQFFLLSVTTLTEIKNSFESSARVPAMSSSSTTGSSAHESINIKTVLDLLIRSSLTLAYVYMELGDLKRALSCINTIDESFGDTMLTFSSTILYAKFTIATKDNDWRSADQLFRELISLNGLSFEMAFDCIQCYINSSKGNRGDIIDSYFKLIAAKFQDGKFFNSLRILQCQYILSHFNDENVSRRGFDLSNAIVRDHIATRDRRLDQSQLDTFYKLIVNQIKFYYTQKLWHFVILWCDLGLSLAEICPEWSCASTSVNKRSFFEFTKCEGLLNTGSYKEAYDLSLQAFASSKTIKNAVQSFRCGLFFFQPREKALRVFLADINSQFDKNVVDNCSRLLLCFDSTKNLPISDSRDIKEIRIKILAILLSQTNKAISNLSSHDAASFLNSIGAPPLTMIYIYLSEFLENHFVIDRASSNNCSAGNNNNTPDAHNRSPQVDSMDISDCATENLEPSESFISNLDLVGKTTVKDNFFNYSMNENTCHFNCSIEEINAVVETVAFMPNYMNLDSSFAYIDEEVESVGDILWNLGLLLSQDDSCKFTVTSKSTNDTPFLRKVISAELHELSAQYYSKMKTADFVITSHNCCLCLLASINARVSIVTKASSVTNGAERMSISETEQNDHQIEKNFALVNIQKCIECCERGEEIIRKLSESQSHDLSHSSKGSRDLFIRFHVSLILKEHSLLGKKFTNMKMLESEIGLSDLTSQGLYELADDVSEEPSVSSEFLRSLYSMTLQIANRDAIYSLNNPIMGQCYKKIIALSSTKESALEVIVQVVQQLQSKSHSSNSSNIQINSDSSNIYSSLTSSSNNNAIAMSDEGESRLSTVKNGLAVEDINSIAVITYNAGVTLVELGSFSLAETFFDHATTLLNYSSQSAMWSDIMKSAKRNVLLQQSNHGKTPVFLQELGLPVSLQKGAVEMSSTFHEILFSKPLKADNL